MIKAIIFDFDGLLIDSEKAQFLALQQMFRHINITYRKKHHLNLLGHGIVSIIKIMLEKNKIRYNKKIIETLINLKERLYLKNAKRNIKLMPGALRIIKEARNRNYKVALASSSLRLEIDYLIEMLDLADYFDIIVTGDEVKQTKPNPEIFLKVIKKLGITPDQCVVFEDSYAGYLAALNAGTYCIVIPNSLIKERKKFSKALAVLHSLEHFDFSLLDVISKSYEDILNGKIVKKILSAEA